MENINPQDFETKVRLRQLQKSDFDALIELQTACFPGMKPWLHDFSFARDGIVLPNIETIIVHDVDLELLRRHKTGGTVKNWLDRRKDLYQLHYRDDISEGMI